MNLLGIRFHPHDASMALYDGKSIRFLKTERIKQKKHHAYDDIMEWRSDIEDAWGISYRDIDEVALSPVYSNILHQPDLREVIVKPYDCFPAPIKAWALNHHYTHSLSHLMDSDPDISIVMDGVGDKDICWTVFKKDQIIETGSCIHNGSIGDRMADIGAILGITCETGFDLAGGTGLDLAGKTMGLQSYGTLSQSYYDHMKKLTIYDVNTIFSFDEWVSHVGDMVLARLNKLDWAHTVHVKFGEVILELFKKHCKPDDVIHYSGGVAQNVIWNSLLKRNFKNLIIYPHVGDDGTSLGAVEFLRRKNNLPRVPLINYPFCVHDEAPSSKPSIDTIVKTAKYLSEGKIVAWYQGHGEMGFRALGNRSILMDPRIPHGKDKINSVKMRERFRPFGASILEEHKDTYFDMPFSNEYMLYVGESKTSYFPAITHVDGTCRIQTVKHGSGVFRDLLERFYYITTCPALLNTSLNLAGKPIAGTIAEAEELFATMSIDVLVVGDTIKTKF